MRRTQLGGIGEGSSGEAKEFAAKLEAGGAQGSFAVCRDAEVFARRSLRFHGGGRIEIGMNISRAASRRRSAG